MVRVWGLGRMKKRVDFIPSAQWESYSLLQVSVLFIGDGQGGLVCCDSWGRKESDMTELNCTFSEKGLST